MSTVHKITREEFHRAFDEDDRVELIEGVVFDKMVIGPRHAHAVRQLRKLFSDMPYGSQEPIVVGDSEPEPDLFVVTAFSEHRHPNAEEVRLAIEVSESSYEYDVEVKMPLYTRAGIPNLIVNLNENRLEFYQPGKPGEILVEGDFLGVHLNINELT